MSKKSEHNLPMARYNALLKSAIISETDLDGTIRFVNDEFVKVLGYSRQEVLGKNHRILNSWKHHSEFFKGIYKTVSEGKVWKGIIEDIDKNGEKIWLDTSIVSVLNKNNKPEGYLAIRFDVTRFMKP